MINRFPSFYFSDNFLSLLLIRLLPIVCRPFTFRHFHVCKNRPERRIFRAAGINPKSNRTFRIPHMTNTHLLVCYTIIRTFNAIVIFPAAESIPHGLDRCIDFRCRPIRISVICHNTSQVLVLFVFILNRSLQPVFTVQIHDYATLVKSMFAFKFCFYYEGKILFICFHL